MLLKPPALHATALGLLLGAGALAEADARVILPSVRSAMVEAPALTAQHTLRPKLTPKPEPKPSDSRVAQSPAAHPAPKLPAVDPALKAHIVRSAALWQLDPYLVKAVIQAESAFDPQAVSPKSAVGLMQVLPSTAQDMGLRPHGGLSVAQLLTDAQVSVLVGSKYLAQQLARFGQVDLALAAYNAGPGAVLRAGRRVPAYAETQAYVRRVLALQVQLRQAGTLKAAGA